MVTSNRVLTGRVGYHRSLELAMLELTLFHAVPREMETHSPLDGSTAPPGPGEDDQTRLGSRSPQALDKPIRLVVGWGVGLCIAS